MTLIEHLRELRNRIFKALAALIVGMIVAFIFYTPILDFLKAPYCNLEATVRPDFGAGNDCTLLIFDVLGSLLLRLKVAFIAGVVLSAPFWLYQLWAFITPGLKRNEKKYAIIFVGASTLLFLGGAGLAYITLQNGLKLLLTIGGDGVTAVLSAPEYLGFVISLLVAFGVSFEVPLLAIMLNVVGILRYSLLKKSRRWIYFLTFVFAAIITPTQDPFTMLAMAIPMSLLFEGAIQYSRVNDKRRAAREAREGFGDIDDDSPSPLDTGPTAIEPGPAPLETPYRHEGSLPGI